MGPEIFAWICEAGVVIREISGSATGAQAVSEHALHKHKIEPAAKLAGDFAQAPGLGKAELAVHADRGDVGGVHAADHDVLAAALGLTDKAPDQRGPDASPVRAFTHINRMFDGERITGPRPEVAEAR